jgi:hypothetical protein
VQLGDTPGSVMTNAGGHYSFSTAGPGNVTVQPQKNGQFNAAITSLDAVTILQAIVNQVTLTPEQEHAADVTGNGSFSTLDATRILQFVAGEQPFNQFQRLACDVTGNGGCSPLDATRVLQFVAATLPRFPAAELCQSDWLFVPDAAAAPNQILTQPQVAGSCQMGRIAYVPLTGDAADQDFNAVLLGDVTGNWGQQ